MHNIEMTQDGNILTLKVDLSQVVGRSSSGLSEIIASTRGNAKAPNDPNIRIGLNIYRKQEGGK